jgi:oxysterol-binding protein-related protein 9/10/11
VSRALSITIKQVGHAILRFPNRKTGEGDEEEAYLITLPSLYIEGLLSGAPYVELSGQSSIISTTGYVAKLDYSGKGWFSGKKNTFSGTLSKLSSPKVPIYTVSGQWTGAFCVNHAATKEIVEQWNPVGKPVVPLTVPKIEDQGELESRKAWSKVAAAIQKGDMDTVGKEKTIIEQQQRELRKKEKEEGKEWTRKFFQRQHTDSVFERLGKQLGESLELDKTGGVWVYTGETSGTK